MSPTDSVKCARKLRGFTLIEMLVVMAIIAVLAGIMSIAISGFQRDARMETDNKMAQQVYMGFQNMLTRCEIMQDGTVFDADVLSGANSYSGGAALTYAEVQFSVVDTDISGTMTVTSVYGGTTVTASLTSGSAGYEKLRKAIKDNLAFDTDGTMVVYVNFSDYVVDSACFFETTDAAQALTQLNMLNLDSATNTYRTLKDTSEQKALIKNKGAYIGAYPFESAIT